MTAAGRRWRRAAAGACALGLAADTGVLAPAAQAAPAHAPGNVAPPAAGGVQVRLMAINGFGGNLRPPGDTGGAAYLAAYLGQLRGAAPASLLFSTGDNVGDTPFESALFHDEPTIEFLNSQNLTASAIGNHDLDHGMAELRRLQLGGCHPDDGCRFTPGFAGASFPMIGSDLTLPDGLPATLPFGVGFVGSVPVGTIAVTPRDLATRVAPAGVADVTVTDPLETVDRTADLLRFLGVHAIVLLLHEDLHVAADTPDGCASATGPAREVIDHASPAVDIIFTGGSDGPFACTFPDPDNRPRAVLQAGRGGTGVSVADVTLDPATGDVLRDRVGTFNQPVRHDITPDAAAQRLVDRAVDAAAPEASRHIGTAAAPLTRAFGPTGESTLGSVVADAQAAATRDAGAQVALTNPGGLRADLPSGEITFADVFTAQPFRNPLRTLTLTGAQLTAVLEQQFRDDDAAVPAVMLQPSSGLHYTIDAHAPRGSRIRDITVAGRPLGPGDTVRVTVNAFLADGGDGFSAFTHGTDPQTSGTDTDALSAYLAARSPVAAPAGGRITVR